MPRANQHTNRDKPKATKKNIAYNRLTRNFQIKPILTVITVRVRSIAIASQSKIKESTIVRVCMIGSRQVQEADNAYDGPHGQEPGMFICTLASIVACIFQA